MKTKDATIRVLKGKLRERNAGSSETKLKKEQQKHQRLINARKTQRKKSKANVVPREKYMKLLSENKEKDEIIRTLETQNLQLQENLEEIQSSLTAERKTRIDEKTYNCNTCLMVYDSIVNQIPTQNIPTVLESHSREQDR